MKTWMTSRSILQLTFGARFLARLPYRLLTATNPVDEFDFRKNDYISGASTHNILTLGPFSVLRFLHNFNRFIIESMFVCSIHFRML